VVEEVLISFVLALRCVVEKRGEGVHCHSNSAIPSSVAPSRHSVSSMCSATSLARIVGARVKSSYVSIAASRGISSPSSVSSFGE